MERQRELVKLFNTFLCFSFFMISDGTENLVFFTPSWPEVEV